MNEAQLDEPSLRNADFAWNLEFLGETHIRVLLDAVDLPDKLVEEPIEVDDVGLWILLIRDGGEDKRKSQLRHCFFNVADTRSSR
jgi:hypothetical protein